MLLERADELRALDTVLDTGGVLVIEGGIGEVGGFFARTMELSAGTFGIDIQDILAAGDQVVVLCTVSAERHGQSWSSPEVHVWRVAGGRAVAFREFQGDEQTEDAFWSA